ncbi:MAG: SMP-30/gluconolactonase/LRE family protein [Pirellulaceae bacterium]
MSERYLLHCQCDREVSVTPRQAGEQIRCLCGRELSVPRLRELRNLPPDSTPPETKQTKPVRWSFANGIVFSTGLATLLVTGILAYWFASMRSQLQFEAPTVEQAHLAVAPDVEKIRKATPIESWDRWKQARSIRLDTRPTPIHIQVRDRVQQLSSYLFACSIVGIAAAVMVVGAFLIRPQRRLAALLLAIFVIPPPHDRCWAQAPNSPPAESATGSVVAGGATLEKLPGEYRFTEGPSVDRKGDVYFTDQPNDRIVKWTASTGQVEDWLKPAGRANGTWVDRHGNLIACADEKNQLWSITPDKTVTVLLKDYDGKLFNGPNDVWERPSGGLYFTDPLYRRDYWQRDPAPQQDGQHVYYLAPGGTKAFRVTSDLRQPNGIIGTADGTTLYVADIGASKTYAYHINDDGTLTDKRLFCEQGSDGMTIDRIGNVYLTGRGVAVYNPRGEKIEQIDVPQRWTANVTFAGPHRDILFITASTAIYSIKMQVQGVPGN